MGDTENQNPATPPADASPPAGDTTPPATPPPDSQTPKFELKEGVMTVDGKKVVYESDLIAAKKSLEQRIEESQTVHNQAIDQAKLDLSNAQSQLNAANAKVQELNARQATGAASAEEVARQKQEVDTAKAAVTDANNKVLEMTKQNMLLRYPGKITEEQLKDKTPEQLSALDEALKVVSQNGGGPGQYATGGGGGGTAPMSEMDRARAIINSTPYRGVQNPPQAQQQQT